MKNFQFILIVTGICALIGCKKENDLLDAKPNQALNTISSLSDLDLLLQNERVFNSNYPAYGEASTDDIYLDYATWLGAFPSEQNAYVWAKTIFADNENGQDWVYPYQMVYYANTILQALPNLPSTTQQQYNRIKGSALFFRSIAFYNLLQEFAPPYQAGNASKLDGIILPMTPNVNAKLGRSPLDQSYDQIINDLKISLPLLPDIASVKTAPSKAAVLALLSRIYLVMADYQKAKDYANQSLTIYNTLQDFNKLNPSAFPMFPNFSPEEVFHAGVTGSTSTSFRSLVDTVLLKSFIDPNDLRPSIFFYNDKGKFEFNSQFDVQSNITYSLSTAEMLFNKAECEARLNDPVNALKDLNAVLINRWATGAYPTYSGLSSDKALSLILNERRKEFVMTTLRWSDLRRLNQDPRFAVTILRNLNGINYSLPPNDPKYTLPIPNSELKFNPITQNNR